MSYNVKTFLLHCTKENFDYNIKQKCVSLKMDVREFFKKYIQDDMVGGVVTKAIENDRNLTFMLSI